MAPWVALQPHALRTSGLPVERRRQRADGRELRLARCPAGEPDAGTYRGTFHGKYVGYWSIFCTGGLDAKLDKFYPPKRAAYLKAQLGDIPGTDINFFGDESTHEVAWRAVGTAEIKDHLSQMPWMVVLRVARMWDLFRPRQNIHLNGVLEGRGVWQSRLATIEYFPLLALSILGLVLLRRRRVPILPFLAIAATITITAATSFGITRYRAPVDAMLPVLAGGALVWLFECVRRAASRADTGSGQLAALTSRSRASTRRPRSCSPTHLNARRFGNPAFLDWFYGANPRGTAIVEDIDDDHGRRIAHYGVLPTTFRTPGGHHAVHLHVERRDRSRARAARACSARWPSASTRARGDGRARAGRHVERGVVGRRRREVRLDEPGLDAGGRRASRRSAARRPRHPRSTPRSSPSDEFAQLAADLDWVPVRDWVQSWTPDFLRWRLGEPRRDVRAARRARRDRREHARSRPARDSGRGPVQGLPPAGRARCRFTAGPLRDRRVPGATRAGVRLRRLERARARARRPGAEAVPPVAARRRVQVVRRRARAQPRRSGSTRTSSSTSTCTDARTDDRPGHVHARRRGLHRGRASSRARSPPRAASSRSSPSATCAARSSSSASSPRRTRRS